jgi:hypothetical protein
MRRNLDEVMADLKARRELVQKERDWFQRPQVPDRPDHSAGWDSRPEWSGSSWSGERWSGRNQSGGRSR